MLEGFKTFILRGNVLELAVGVIIGASFTAIVNSLVKDLITPVFGVFGGIPDFSALFFEINGSQFMIGNFINVVITFVLTAAVLYWFIITPANRLMELRKVEEPVTVVTKECPECLSKIPANARRCSFCTTVLVQSDLTTPEMANPDAGAGPDGGVRLATAAPPPPVQPSPTR